MNIEVHHGGHFGLVGNTTQYVGGQVEILSDFDSDKMSWFELRFMLKEIGYVNNYIVFQLLPNQPLSTGLVEINSDKSVLEMLNKEENIVLYILPTLLPQEELLPEYCLEDPMKKIENPKTMNPRMAAVGKRVGHVAVSENVPVTEDNVSAESIDGDGDYDNNIEDDESEESDDGYDGDEVEESVLVDKVSEDVLGGTECDPGDDCQSEYMNFGSLHTPLNSDVEDDGQSKIYPTFSAANLDNPTIDIGMEFESAAQFRQLMRHHAIRGSFDLNWAKNEAERIVVKCKALECKFRVFAALNLNTGRFQIRSIVPNHTCTRALHNTQVTSSWLSQQYLELFRADPNMKWKVFMNTVQRQIGVTISRNCAYRTRKKAVEQIQGKDFLQFKKIRQYATALLESNPGSVAIVKTSPIAGDDQSVGFEAIFIAYAACVRGFVNGCRPIIGMDGCHLSNAAGGILLSAVARDGNNQMFPIAIAIVEVENRNTWSWFIGILIEAVGVDKLQGVTFLTDRQKGLVESLKALVPSADIRCCVRHLYANFKEKFKGLKLKRLLWQAASAYNKEDHEVALKELLQSNKDAYEYLTAIDKKQWARCHFNVSTSCDLICNNISEAFNKYILEARDKPIITMLEMIKRQLMIRLQTKREQMASHGCPICPKIMKKIDEISLKSRKCTAFYAGSDNFEVRDKGGHCCVNLFKRECDCKEWSLTGIPCRHGMAAIRYMRGNPVSYIHDCYSTSRYIRGYEGIIFPIPDSSQWKEDAFMDILPPKLRRQPGRPAKSRKKAPDEASSSSRLVISRANSVLRCSQCKEVGHNKRRCGQARGQQGVREQEGRTRKRTSRDIVSSINQGSNEHEGRTRKRIRREAQPTQASAERERGSATTTQQSTGRTRRSAATTQQSAGRIRGSAATTQASAYVQGTAATTQVSAATSQVASSTPPVVEVARTRRKKVCVGGPRKPRLQLKN